VRVRPLSAVLVGSALAIAGCHAGTTAAPATTVSGSPVSASSPDASAAAVSVAASPADGQKAVAPGTIAKISVAHGQLVSVSATATPTAAALAVQGAATTRPPLVGTLTGPTAWTSASPLVPNTAYRLAVLVRDTGGHAVTRTVAFTTAPPTTRLTLSIAPVTGEVVGVAQPVAVYFDQPVSNEAAVQAALHVTTNKAIGPAGWHWFSPYEVQYRPKAFWPALTTVTLQANLDGVPAGGGVWGGRTYTDTFQIGHAIVSTVNGASDTFTVTQDGKVIRQMPTGTGKTGFETWTGILVTEEKYQTIQMNSASVNIFGAQAYNLGVHWAVRVTNSGTFVHAAPWDTALGRANVSHGCIHLSTSDAEWYYNLSLRGDPVIVSHTGGQPVAPTNGFAGWNMTWSQWMAGSA